MQLRRNHNKRGGGLSIIRMVIFVLLLLIVLYLLFNSLNGNLDNHPNKIDNYGVTLNDDYDTNSNNYLPSSNGDIISHSNFTLSYLDHHEQAEWVAYELTEEMLKKPNVKRSKRFTKDPKVLTGSAGYYDYRGSGFTRGHLAPAGDMAHDITAMQESFNMSNISPQIRAFNNGIWKELEEQVRDWVYHNDQLYIVTGPILTDNITEHISKKNISVPKRFYKVLLDNSGKSKKGIAFIIPHRSSDLHLKEYAVPIDSVESITGIDFFYKFDNSSQIRMLESEFHLDQWDFSDARYKLRVDRWNKE
jgi:endonuclease G